MPSYPDPLEADDFEQEALDDLEELEQGRANAAIAAEEREEHVGAYRVLEETVSGPTEAARLTAQVVSARARVIATSRPKADGPDDVIEALPRSRESVKPFTMDEMRNALAPDARIFDHRTWKSPSQLAKACGLPVGSAGSGAAAAAVVAAAAAQAQAYARPLNKSYIGTGRRGLPKRARMDGAGPSQPAESKRPSSAGSNDSFLDNVDIDELDELDELFATRRPDEVQMQMDDRESPEALLVIEREERDAREEKTRREQARVQVQSATGAAAYVSPLERAYARAVHEGRNDDAWKIKLAIKHDKDLCEFLHSLALAAEPHKIAEVKLVRKQAVRLLEQYPFFRTSGDGESVEFVDPERVCSFSPCIITGATRRPDGTVVSNLEAMFLYIDACEGRAKYLLREVGRDGRVTFDMLYGTGILAAPLASTIKDPGIYFVNPASRFVIIGMTHALGIARRTAAYVRTTWSEGTKMGAVQSRMRERDWPGEARALMWHKARLPRSRVAVPHAALYGAESLLILLVGTSFDGIDAIKSHIRQYGMLPPRGGHTAGRVPLGLNTSFADKFGAYLRQPCLSIAGARELLRMLEHHSITSTPLLEWKPKEAGTVRMQQVEHWYRTTFGTVFPASTPMSTLYSHVTLRTLVMQRAGADEPDVLARIDWELLPGKNRRAWRKSKWM